MLPTSYNTSKFWNLDDIFDVFSYKSSTGSVNVSEDKEKYSLEFNIAGMNKDNINISIEDGVLKVKGNVEDKEEDNSTNCHRSEFTSKSFERTFQLPEDVTDEINASAKKGILVVEIPKRKYPEKDKFKQIEIK